MSDQCCQFTMTDEDEIDRPDDTTPAANPETGCCGTGAQRQTDTPQATNSCCDAATPAGVPSTTSPAA